MRIGRATRPRLPNLFALTGLLILGWVAMPRPGHAQGWAKIDCSGSRVTSAPMTTCWQGPVNGGNTGTGYFEQYAASAESNTQYNYVRIGMKNKRKCADCYVYADLNWTTDLKVIIPRVKNQARNWSGIEEVAGTTGMRFELPDRNCFAFYKLGGSAGIPGLAGGSFEYRGLVCGAVGKSALTDNQIATFLSSIRVNEP